MRLIIAVLLIIACSPRAQADYACASIALDWRHGHLGLFNSRPVVSDLAGFGHILRSDTDTEWQAFSSTAVPYPDPAFQPLDYSADQWNAPQEVILSSASGSRVSIQALADDISDENYPNRWNPKDTFLLNFEDQTSTVTLKGVYGFRGMVRSPTNANVLYVLTQQPLGEDDPCGNGDGPGLIEIDTKARTARLIFPNDNQAGIWAIQFLKGQIVMLTSSGVCMGPKDGGTRRCWSYHYAKVVRPGGARAFLEDGFGRKPPQPTPAIPPIKDPLVTIIGGKENDHLGTLHFQIQHPAATRQFGVYVEPADVLPMLSKDE